MLSLMCKVYLLTNPKVWKYQPDMVILGVYPGNDLFDNYYPLDYTDPELRPHFVLREGVRIPAIVIGQSGRS